MTVKAAIETNYSNIFREKLADNQPVWLKVLRENAFDRFATLGFPTPRNENWKYTNIASLAREDFAVNPTAEARPDDVRAYIAPEAEASCVTFVNGKFDAELTNLSGLPAGAAVLNLNAAATDERFGALVKEHLARLVDYNNNGFAALNTALTDDGVFIFVPRETKLAAPLQLLFVMSDAGATFPRVLLVAERGAEATLIESYYRTAEAKYLTNAVVEIVLADDAKLSHYRVQRESHNAFHVTTTQVNLNRASVYNATSITLGGKLSRHDIGVKFHAEGAEAFVDGLYLVSEDQHADTHSVIDHAVPRCTSHQTYKGILDGQSRAVFNGKVLVRLNANGTDAQQSNKNLLLSNEARVDTKPQLEIFNEDVKCAHGATVGQLEDEELFYLLSRGLNEDLARNLLTYGFAEEIVNKIGIPSIKKQLDEAVLNRLHANLEA